MHLGIRLHPADLSLYDTFSELEKSGVQRAGPAVVAHASADGEPDEDGSTVSLYGTTMSSPQRYRSGSRPFEPTVRDGHDGEPPPMRAAPATAKERVVRPPLYGLYTARDSRTTDRWDPRVKAEEENRGEHLYRLARERREELGANVAIVADGPIDESGRPHVLLGSHGLRYVGIETRGANRDRHLGNFGGSQIARNADGILRGGTEPRKDGATRKF